MSVTMSSSSAASPLLLWGSSPPPSCPTGLNSSPPRAGSLTYEIALPCSLAGPGVARALTSALLRQHELEGMREAAVQCVSELVAVACRFGPVGEVQLALAYEHRELEIVVQDGHPPHRSLRLAAVCDARRERALAVLDRVVNSCGGDWDYDVPTGPRPTTRVWAVLPYEGAVEYGRGG